MTSVNLLGQSIENNIIMHRVKFNIFDFTHKLEKVNIIKETDHYVTLMTIGREAKRSCDWWNYFHTIEEVDEFIKGKLRGIIIYNTEQITRLENGKLICEKLLKGK